jgi:hypothetical protein
LSPAGKKLVSAYLKTQKEKNKAGDMAQVVEPLPRMCQILGLILRTAKKVNNYIYPRNGKAIRNYLKG